MEKVINLDHYNPASWLSRYKQYTLKARIISTNIRFFQYLSSDGIYIHHKYRKQHPQESLDLDQIEENSPEKQKNLNTNQPTYEAISNKNNEDYSSQQEIASEESAVFPEFDEEIMKVLEEFDNKVFIKLNWKAPKDIDTWVPKLLCQSIEDIFLALKSSTLIGDMLENCFPKPENLKKDADIKEIGGFDLILKKWQDLNKSLEFRCFIKNEKLIAISQRYMKNPYAFLNEKGVKTKILELIEAFYNNFNSIKFNDESYTLDVYLEIFKEKWRIWLIDINPWGNLTNPLLFTWEELEKMESIEFRIVEGENTIIFEGNQGICMMPEEWKGEDVKKWVEMIGNQNNNPINNDN